VADGREVREAREEEKTAQRVPAQKDGNSFFSVDFVLIIDNNRGSVSMQIKTHEMIHLTTVFYGLGRWAQPRAPQPPQCGVTVYRIEP